MTKSFFRTLFRHTLTPTPVVTLVVWVVGVTIAIGLGAIRAATDAEFAFAAAIIFPVAAVAWFVSKRQGLVYSILAAVVWVWADIQAGKEFSASWIVWANGMTRFGVYSLVAFLTASLREVLVRECEMARHDSLTGLLNRRSFFEVGTSESARAERYNHSLAVIFLDLDNFKELNDTRGHEVGDLALKTVAKALMQTLRGSDLVARLGGDEFSVILPEIRFQAASDTGHKISHAINASLNKFSPVSVSVGVAWFDHVAESFAYMLNAADSLMYEIKKEGKQGVRAKQFIVPVNTQDRESD